jgi:putative membrane protein
MPSDSTASMTKFDPASVTRPDPSLMHYYIICALLTIAGFPFVLIALYIRFRTLKYKFDDKGVSMSVGILFRRETYLTYRRIQDIHVTRNIIHRWLGLSAVAVQTAAGSSSAEMTIEGIRDPDGLRDFLYLKMRGAREDGHETHDASKPAEAAPQDEALALLREIRNELHGLRSREGRAS